MDTKKQTFTFINIYFAVTNTLRSIIKKKSYLLSSTKLQISTKFYQYRFSRFGVHPEHTSGHEIYIYI